MDAGADSTTTTPGAFTLTSPAFMTLADPDAGVPKDAGPTIPAVDTCSEADAGNNPPGVSPELDWTAGPAGTMSYVITLVDISINNYHWAVWDIPATTMQLPEGLPKGVLISMPASLAGAYQNSFQNDHQYVGPCPRGNMHEYQFSVFAIPTAKLNVPDTASSMQAYMQAVKVATARATLTGLSNATPGK
jgi:Raf kinase inhibitor-like YbhB/YbcL family protein